MNASNDQWIPRKGNFKLVMGLGGLAFPRMEFIILDRSRNMERLRELYVHVDVADIINIPLSLREVDDSFYWFYYSKGFHSIKSGYGLAEQMNRAKNVGSATDLDGGVSLGVLIC